MKRALTALVLAVVIAGGCASQSQAYCVQAGQIVGATLASTHKIYVQAPAPGSIMWQYKTTDPKIVNAALTAQASHQHVQILGGDVDTVCSTAGHWAGVVAAISVGDVP